MQMEAVDNKSNMRAKLHGRAFYEAIGSPKYVLAPMVDQSEFAWRMLSRSYLAPSQRPSLLAYTPMFHAKLFADSEKYRASHFQAMISADGGGGSLGAARPGTAHLDGNPAMDRPLFVQFCANEPETLLEAARRAAPFCDAVDLNLGCPQGIARRGRYGAFLQEDQDLVFRLINTLHRELPVPVTAKIRILNTREATLAYARNVLAAGASILTVHGRRREQKGHLTGLADWAVIRWLRDQLPPETVLFANGNVLHHRDLQRCLDATGADAVMSAEGNLSDPAIFATPPLPPPLPPPSSLSSPPPPPGLSLDPPPALIDSREYWIGRDGKGGFRVDGVMRRYLDILHKYVTGAQPPPRRPLFIPGDAEGWISEAEAEEGEQDGPPAKKRKKDKDSRGPLVGTASMTAIQAHLFHLLRHFVSRHTDVRDTLGKSRPDIWVYEKILLAVEAKVARGLVRYEETDGKSLEEEEEAAEMAKEAKVKVKKAGAATEHSSTPRTEEATGIDNGAKGAAAAAVAEAEAEAEEEAAAAAAAATPPPPPPPPPTTTTTGGPTSHAAPCSDDLLGQQQQQQQDDQRDYHDPESSVAAIRACKRPWWIAQPIVRPLPKEALAKGSIQPSKKEKLALQEASQGLRAETPKPTADADADTVVLAKTDALVAG